MSKKYNAPRFPSPLPQKRFARNVALPSTTALRRAAMAINYAAAEQHRHVFAKAYDTVSVPAGSATTANQHVFIFQTGVNTASLNIMLGIAPADTSGVSQPSIALTLVNSSGTVVTKYARHWSLNTSGTYTPAEIAWKKVEITTADGIEDDTVYRLQVATQYYARCCSMSGWLMGNRVSDDTNTGVVDARAFEADREIYDSDIQALIEAATAVYKKNGAHLIAWSQDEIGNRTEVSSSTWTNLVSVSTTAYSATTAGFYIPTQYHNTKSRTSVPVRLGVFGERISGTGNFSIRLVDSSGEIFAETGVTSTEINALPAHIVDGTIPAQASEKIDIQIRSDDNSSVYRVYAVSLWEYEA